MISLEQNELSQAFPLEPVPTSSTLTVSHGDDVDKDVSVLHGKRWDQLKPGNFRLHFEVVCWLTPQAFRYYLAAIINCSLIELDSQGELIETELVVDYTIRMIPESNIKDVEDRLSAIWSLFSERQLSVVRKWIEKLAKYQDAMPVSSETLIAALDKRTTKNAGDSRGSP